MEISVREGNMESFFSHAQTVAEHGEHRIYTPDAKNRLELIFETQEEAYDALASAWIHRFRPSAFHRFHTFNALSADPLYGSTKKEGLTQKLVRNIPLPDVPWLRRQMEGGVDTFGTLGISNNDQEGVIIFGMRLAMEHLAFLSVWLNKQANWEVQMGESNSVTGTPVMLRFSSPEQVPLGLYFQMLPEDQPLVERFNQILAKKGQARVVTPTTLVALDYWSERREEMFDMSAWSSLVGKALERTASPDNQQRFSAKPALQSAKIGGLQGEMRWSEARTAVRA